MPITALSCTAIIEIDALSVGLAILGKTSEKPPPPPPRGLFDNGHHRRRGKTGENLWRCWRNRESSGIPRMELSTGQVVVSWGWDSVIADRRHVCRQGLSIRDINWSEARSLSPSGLCSRGFSSRSSLSLTIAHRLGQKIYTIPNRHVINRICRKDTRRRWRRGPENRSPPCRRGIVF